MEFDRDFFKPIGVKYTDPIIKYMPYEPKQIKEKFDWDEFFMWGGIVSLIVAIIFLGFFFGGPEFGVFLLLGFLIGTISSK